MITIYTGKNCPWCDIAKKYLKKKGLKFKEVVIDNKKDIKKLKDISGSLSVPTIVINKTVIIGFDKEKIDKVIK